MHAHMGWGEGWVKICIVSAVGMGKDALAQKLSRLFMIVLGSVQSQRVNTSPLINLWSCMPSAITPLGVFQSSLLFLLCSIPVEVDFSFCISNGQKSLILCQFFSVYLVVFVKRQDFSHRSADVSPLLHLSRSVSAGFSVWLCSCNFLSSVLKCCIFM